MTVDKSGDQNSDLRTVELMPRELELLLNYGYPFAEQEQALRDSKAVKGVHRVRIGAYWIELMIADLVRSAKEIPKHRRNSALLEELDAVCSALEYALAHDHRNVRLR
ncbi:MAG TPA: hypothetical protein VK624_02510 [Steroidobacteraceae bacterium]|nr:hypothetical protein [Steroidobacteraceae bacterium]